jgi:RNAse (barnase) inhibitor barstar
VAQSGLLQDCVSGLHFVAAAALARLLAPAAAMGLHVARVDLAGCAGKPDLLARIAAALAFPPTFGHNWDALADFLADLSWLPGRGVVLVFENAAPEGGLAEADFATLLEILAGTAAYAARQRWRWHALVVVAG